MSEITHRILEPPAGFTTRESGHVMAQLDDLYHRLAEDTRGLTPEQLEWQPSPGSNTIGMLLAHIPITEIYWVQVGPMGLDTYRFEDILGIGSDDDGMPLDEGGRPPATLHGKDLAFFDELIAKGRAFTRRALQGLTQSDLDRVISRRCGADVQEIDMRWVLYHMVEHMACHYGQVNLLRHLEKFAAARKP